MYAHDPTDTCVHTDMHVHTYPCMHTTLHVCLQSAHLCVCTHDPTDTCMHTYLHMDTRACRVRIYPRTTSLHTCAHAQRRT